MNNKNRNNEQWLMLIERYYDALTTPQEERELKDFLSTPQADAPCFDEIKATLAYFATAKHKHKRTWSIANTITRGIAAAAILAAIISVWPSDREQNICIAYIDGRIETDEALVMQNMQNTMAMIGQTTSENSIEKQLSDMFNIQNIEEE